MKFAFSTKILRLHTLRDAIDIIAKAGFCAVELMADRPHAFPNDLTAARITELNQCLSDRKMKVSNINAAAVTALGDAHHPSWLEEDWQQRELRIRYTLDCMRLAAAMGVPNISTMGGGPIPSTTNRENAFRLFVANMHRVLPLAKKLEVKLLIEPEPDRLIESSDHMLQLLEELEFPDALKVNFDIGHFYCVGEDPCRAWEKLNKHVAHVHFDDVSAKQAHRHTQLGEGVVDLRAFLECAQKSGYEGFLSVHLECHDQNPEKMVYAAAAYLQEAGLATKKIDHCLLTAR